MGRPREFDDRVVVERAMETFWTHGYAGTTPAKLVEATGLGKGSLYNAFHSKRELFDRSLDAYHEQTRTMASQLMQRPGTTTECLRAALRAVVDLDMAQPQRRGCLIGNTAVELSGEDPELAVRLKRMQDESAEWFAERIRRGRLERDIDVDKDPRALADFLATVMAGLRVMAMNHDEKTLYGVIDAALTALD